MGTGPFPLKVEWAYVTPNVNLTTPAQNLILGAHRVLSYQRSITLYKTPSVQTAYVARPDGNTYRFTLIGSTWTPDPDVDGVLTSSQDASGAITGWNYLNKDGEIESYDGTGELVSIQNNQGFVQQLSYNSNGQLFSVTDPLKRSLTFQYNTAGQISAITEPDGRQLILGYDTNGNSGAVPVDLQTVTYPDGNKLTYVYQGFSIPGDYIQSSILTGIIDENGSRYSTTQYNSSGQAIGTFLSGNVDAESATYTASADRTYQATAVITKALGETETVTNTAILGVVLPTQIVSSCASGCPTRTETYGYDANGRMNRFSDSNGNITAYTFDSAGLETQRVEAQGTPVQRTVNTTWNDALRSPLERTVLDVNGNLTAKTDWVYSVRGQTIARCEDGATSYVCSASGTAPAGVRRWVYTYCTAAGSGCPLAGLLLSVQGPRTDLTQTTTYSYYTTSSAKYCGTPGSACYQAGDLHRITDALGHNTTYVSYDAAGRPTRITDANGISTSMTYTTRGWLHNRNVAGAITTIAYDAVGDVTKVTQPDGVFTSYGYDAAHRLTTITDALGNTVKFTLDAAGDRTAENTYASGSSSPSLSLSRVYNSLGELVKDLDAYSQTTQYGYDANGNRTDITDPLGVKTHESYDALNRLSNTIRNYLGSDPATTTFGYDSHDNLTELTDPDGLNTTYSYSGLNDLDQLLSPDTGTTHYTYDAVGNRATQTDARGITATYIYDALNRMASISYPTATLNVHYYYDEANGTTGCASSKPIGRLTEMVDATGTTTYCYDAHGNVTLKRQVIGANTYATGYTWNAADRLMGMTYPDGATVTYTRDADGRIASVSATGTAIVSAISYLPFGPATGYTFAEGGQSLGKLYDANYRATDIEGSALNLHFTLDAMGDIKAEGNAAGVPTPNETYLYDPLYRLQQVDDASGTPWQTYSYNGTGDRLTKAMAGLGTDSYTYQSGTHRLLSIGGYDVSNRAVDADGNTTAFQANGWTYGLGYNDTNRLALVQQNGSTVATYGLNGQGERVAKTFAGGGTQVYAYDEGGHLLAEYTTGQSRDYVWADGTLVAILDNPAQGGDTIHYVYTDNLGTPRSLTTQSGTLVWDWPYNQNPFGEAAASGSSYTLNLRYPGQYYDQEDGLNYNYFRDYEPATGRYAQSDPTGLDGGTSTYAYANGSPVSFIDPSGTQAYASPYRTQGASTIICDGNGEIIIFVVDDDPCTKDCTAAHEEVHRQDAMKSNSAACHDQPYGMQVKLGDDQVTNDKSEARAWQKELDCLREKLAALKDCDKCRQSIEKLMKTAKERAVNYGYRAEHPTNGW